MMNRVFAGVAVSALMIAAAAVSATESSAQAQAGEAKYEFMKATDNRVWRLNRVTGEISVCTLEQDTMVCSTSSAAAQTPETTYEELQEREASELAAAAEQDAEERQRALKMIDRMMQMFREFVAETPAGESQ